MKLVQLRIHNFRCIRDASFGLESYSLLVGANNAGKSTVIDCLRAVYEKDKYKFSIARDNPAGELADKDSWAELTFELTADEFAGLAEKYRGPGNSLRLRKCFLSEKDPENQNGILFGYLTDGTLDTAAFYGAKGVQNGKIGDIIYVPAVSTIDDHAKLTGPSALRDLLIDLLGSVVEGSESYAAFSAQFEKFVEEVKTAKTSNNQSLSAFEQELDERLSEWNVGFEIQFQPPSVQEIVKSMLGWGLLDEITNRAFDHKCFGSGFQRHFIFSLVSVGSRYARQAPTKKSKDFTPSMRLLLFEEPEAFLHPPQQESLSRDLARLTEKEGWQVLCSTHSPHFVTRQSEKLTSLVRLRNANGISRAYQIDAEGWRKLLDARTELEAFMSLANDLDEDERSRLEVLRYFLWLNPERCGLFFAEKVLLVEGLTEVGLFNRLMGDGTLPIEARNCYVLGTEGKHNTHRFIRLLAGLGVPHLVMFDNDASSTNPATARLNQLIHDSKSPEFTKGIIEIPENLESYLKMPKPDRRLKPLLAIQRYESKQFDAARLASLCDQIRAGLS